MTDSATTPDAPFSSMHTGAEARTRLKRRYRAEANFKVLGIVALLVAVAFLAIILSSIVIKGVPAFVYNFASIPISLQEVDPAAPAKANYDGIVKDAIRAIFPNATSRPDQKLVASLLSSGAPVLLREQVVANPGLIDNPKGISLPVSDFVDLYLKGQVIGSKWVEVPGQSTVAQNGEDVTITFPSAALSDLKGLATSGETELKTGSPSVLVYLDGRVIKASSVTATSATGSVILGDPSLPPSVAGARIRLPDSSEAQRKFSDREMVWTDALVEKGYVSAGFNWIFATKGASREAEMAGILGAVLGSALTLIVTLAVAFPIGVAAAIYLEEFAPRNPWTTIIEVNINNLAAVPSIVFGLLGLAVFLNFFGLDRSAPYVGGLVLALMTLPTIIIAARVALRAVPPSIREAALGVGASKIQAVFHHVLPLAMPGVLTGAILGMARALGETAPLLMIGMVAFVVDLPSGFASPATVLPVQIYMWADFPEPAFEQRTSAGILVLLAFLVLMNLTAILLRRRFERRW
jgi:phosphate transport system permease protein